jgi:hypothetical protein
MLEEICPSVHGQQKTNQRKALRNPTPSQSRNLNDRRSQRSVVNALSGTGKGAGKAYSSLDQVRGSWRHSICCAIVKSYHGRRGRMRFDTVFKLLSISGPDSDRGRLLALKMGTPAKRK